MSSYTLRARGTDLRVETWVEPAAKKPNRARLLADGIEVDTGESDEIGHVDLGRDSAHQTRVAWWWTGRIAKCVLVEPGRGDVRRRSVPYAPPPGTRAARVHAWGEEHSYLFAARHVVLNLGGTLFAVLGVSALLKALFSGLLPAIDLGLPTLHAPEWLKALDPSRYLAPLFGWVDPLFETLLGWVPDFAADWLKYVVGLVFALSLAVREVRRRQRVARDSSTRTERTEQT